MSENNVVFEDYRTENSYDIACYSGIGRRESQQDSAYVYADNDTVFALLCDGMGGVKGGQTASQSAVSSFVEQFNQGRLRHKDLVDSWIEMLKTVDDIVYNLKDETGSRLGAGTTFALAYIHEDKLYWLSVGDSRIYLLRGSELVQVTTDHNYYLRLNQQLERGEISEYEYEKESQKGEALISFIGMGGLLLIDVNDTGFAIQSGDKVIVCSDGLYRSVLEGEIVSVLSASPSASDATSRLSSIVEKAGLPTQDNYTYTVIHRK